MNQELVRSIQNWLNQKVGEYPDTGSFYFTREEAEELVRYVVALVADDYIRVDKAENTTLEDVNYGTPY